ncbi:MAG TPA: hypothetical protein VHL53_01895, partial [Acidimicrobiia bacterium]|nr:hypothetical protein [Acidimicrobiia bacterium]
MGAHGRPGAPDRRVAALLVVALTALAGACGTRVAEGPGAVPAAGTGAGPPGEAAVVAAPPS